MPCFARSLILALALICSLPALALEDTPENRAQEAGRYLEAVPPDVAVANLSRRIAASLPQPQQAQFLADMKKDVNMAAVREGAKAALAKVFTADELNALANFYGSPLGKSSTEKMGHYMAEVMPTIVKEVDAAATKAKQQTAQQK